MEELNIGSREVFADIGAWQGDTIRSFLRKTKGSYRHIYAVEPDPVSYGKLCADFGGKKNITLHQRGLGKEKSEFYLNMEGSQSGFLTRDENASRIKVEVSTMDELFGNKKVSLIKIGVPFLYLDILEGGLKLFQKDRPRLIINVAADNRFLLPDIIKTMCSLDLDYRFSLRFDFPMPTRLHMYLY